MKKICIELPNWKAKEMIDVLYQAGGTDIRSRRLGRDTTIINSSVPRLEALKIWCNNRLEKGTHVYM